MCPFGRKLVFIYILATSLTDCSIQFRNKTFYYAGYRLEFDSISKSNNYMKPIYVIAVWQVLIQ